MKHSLLACFLCVIVSVREEVKIKWAEQWKEKTPGCLMSSQTHPGIDGWHIPTYCQYTLYFH